MHMIYGACDSSMYVNKKENTDMLKICTMGMKR